MIFIDKMKNFKIYKTKTFLPTVKGNKKKGSAVLMFTPSYESSNRLMNNKMFVNSNRYASYYMERDVSYYINSKEVEELEESTIVNEYKEMDEYLVETKRSELKDSDFGVPDKRKFPLDTEAHVRSAIKFFNYVDPEDEEELARRIIAAMKKFGINDVNVSEKNRFSKYYHPKKKSTNESVVEEKDEKVAQCKFCGSTDILTKIEGEPVYICKDCGKYLGVVPMSERSETYESIGTSSLSPVLLSETFSTGDKLMFFNEDVNDAQMKRVLYKSRIKKRKDIMSLLDRAKADNPWIRYAFPEFKRYQNRNVFVDLSYYNAVFFENNKWVLKKGMNLYLTFMDRLLNHPNLKQNGYNLKTIFIPVKDWDRTHDGMIWNFKKSINPMSCIYELMRSGNIAGLKKTFGNTDVLFVADNLYFKINFGTLDSKDLTKYLFKFRKFIVKMASNQEDFEAEDIDTTADVSEDKEVVAAKIVDKIEQTKGVDITRRVQKSMLKKEVQDKTTPEDKVKAFDTVAKKSISAGESPATGDQYIKKLNKASSKKIDKLNQEIDDDDEEIDYGEADIEDAERDLALDKLSDAIAAAASDANNEDDAYESDELNTDEVKRILISLGNEDKVNISASRSSRLNQLDTALLDKEVNGRTVRDIIEDSGKSKEPVYTNVEIATPNKDEWKDMSFINFDKDYDLDKDVVRIFRSLAKCTRPIVVRDIKAEDASTSEDRIATYTVNMEDYRGKRFTIKVDIPIMEDNRFLLRGNILSIQTQSFNMPIIKTELDTCQLISNYKKIFMYRFNSAGGRSLPSTAKFLKACKKYKGHKLKISTGNNRKVSNKYHLPMDYIDICRQISKIESDDWIIYFNQDEIRNTYTVDVTNGIPYAYNKKTKNVEYYVDNTNASTFASYLKNLVCDYDPAFKDLYESATRPSTCAYVRAKVMSVYMPIAMICAYHVGLRNTMDRAGIKYHVVDKLTKEIKNDDSLDWIEFDDGYLIYEVTYESSLLMNGLKTSGCNTSLYKLADMDSKDMYLEFLDNFGGRIKADGLDNFYDLFVDPMIEDTLKYYNLPTDYIDILLYGTALLADNKYIRHTDTSSRKLRRAQIIAVYLYQVISESYGKYALKDAHSSNARMEVKQSAVIDKFMQDPITSPDSCLNALRDVETTNTVTTKGPSGMNSDRAYSLDKRSYDKSMVNVLGMSTGFSGNVGISRQTTIDSNVTPDGYIKSEKKEMNDANTLTATEALIPFGSTRDDPMRTAMSFIQTSKHMVRTEESDPLLVTSGFDELMPYATTDKFAFKAKQDGIVQEVTDGYIIVKYQDGTKDYINLDETTEHNSDGGYYVPLKLDPASGLKKNMKFKKDQILAYDKYSFSNSVGESNNIAYNIGKLAKVAVLNTDEGFEDSGIISASMAKKLATRVDVKHDRVVNKDARVFKMVSIGDQVQASDDLLIWEDAFDDADAEEVMSAISSGGFSDVGKRKLKSDVTGVVRDIKIFRTVELEELSPSLRKIVSAYEKPIKARAKLLEENGIKDKSKVQSYYKLPANGKLKRSQEAVLIEIYVEYLDTVGVGDKIVYNSANKAVEKGLFPEGLEPYTDFRPNEKIDAFVGDTSISKRLVTSTFIYGGLQKLMVELDRSVKDILGIPYDDSTV